MTIKARIAAAGAAIALFSLSACGGGGGGSAPNSIPAVAPAAKTATATFTIKVPNAVAQVSAKRPAYISPNTQSASIALISVDGTASKQAATVVNLTPASPGCSSSTGTLVCTAAIPAAAGVDVFSLTLFSAANGGGSQLSTGTVSATIKAAATNTVPIALNGVISAITVSLTPNNPLANGATTTIPVTVTVTDASGATIVGPGNYSSSITLTDSDVSGHTTLSSTAATSAATSIVVTAPGATFSLHYDGSPAIAGQAITIGASATGVAAANVVAATFSARSLASTTVSGAAAFAVLSDPSGNVVAILPGGGGVVTVPLATAALGVLSRSRLSASHARSPAAAPVAPAPLTITPVPDECAPDLFNNELYCMSFSSNLISLISYNPANVLASLTLIGQITTDAPLTGVQFSGATCTICGIAYDPTDKAVIIATANGYELYSPVVGATAPLTTIAAPIAENFGYNADTDQIFSPYYQTLSPTWTAPAASLDVINISGGVGTWYGLLTADIPPSGISLPDAGAVDTKTGIAISPEEGSVPIYLGLIPKPGSASFVSTTPAAKAPGGTVDMTITPVTPSAATYTGLAEMAYTAADSVEDLAFFADEYNFSTDYMAVAQLPTTATVPTGFTTYVDAELPAISTGVPFLSPLDPHASLVVNLPGICADCGVLFNQNKSYMALVDLNKLLALAPALSPNGYDVPTTTDLLTPGVVRYIATNVSTTPSSFARAQAAYRRAHPRTRGVKGTSP